MSFDLKILIAEGDAENFVLTITNYKLLSTQCPKYLFDIIPSSESFYDTSMKRRPNSLSEQLQLAKANFSLLSDLARRLYSMLMTLKVLNTLQD